MTEHNLPENDDAIWLDAVYDGFMTHEEMLEEAAKREKENEVLEIGKKCIEEYSGAMEQLAEIEKQEREVMLGKVSKLDYKKVLNAMEGKEPVYKTLDEMTREERVDAGIQEITYLVMGGQDGREYANSISFIIQVLDSLR